MGHSDSKVNLTIRPSPRRILIHYPVIEMIARLLSLSNDLGPMTIQLFMHNIISGFANVLSLNWSALSTLCILIPY